MLLQNQSEKLFFLNNLFKQVISFLNVLKDNMSNTLIFIKYLKKILDLKKNKNKYKKIWSNKPYFFHHI